MAKGGIVIPGSATLYVQLVASPVLRRYLDGMIEPTMSSIEQIDLKILAFACITCVFFQFFALLQDA